MMLFQAIFGGILALMVWFFEKTRADHASGLRKIPNAHFSCPYSRLWLIAVRWQQHENRARHELHQRLGPVVRLGPKELSVNYMDGGTRVIYGKEFAKEAWYVRAFRGKLPYLFTILDKDEHAERKKMLLRVYSKSSVMASPTLNNAIARVVDFLDIRLIEWANDGTTVDVLDQAKGCLMDILTSWIYGSQSGTDFLREEAVRAHFSKSFDDAHYLLDIFWQGEKPHWLMNTIKVTGLRKMPVTAATAFEKLEQFSAQLTAKASSAMETPYTYFRDRLVKAQSDVSNEDINAIISAELFDHTFAGYAVGGIALAYVMFELSRNPRIQQMLRVELRELRQPSDKPMPQRVEDLKVLDAVLTETLRLRTPNPGPWPRVVPKPGCGIAGFRAPAGTIVSSTSWSLHRNPDVFPSPDRWWPERWLEADEIKRSEMKKWFWAFGSGARMCLGIVVIMQDTSDLCFCKANLEAEALTVMKKILVAVYSDYETCCMSTEDDGSMDQADAFFGWPCQQSCSSYILSICRNGMMNGMQSADEHPQRQDLLFTKPVKLFYIDRKALVRLKRE